MIFFIELFHNRFLQALRDGKHVSPSRLADLLSWKHSGFHIKGGALPPGAHAKGMGTYWPRTDSPAYPGIKRSSLFVMRPASRPRYLYAAHHPPSGLSTIHNHQSSIGTPPKSRSMMAASSSWNTPDLEGVHTQRIRRPKIFQKNPWPSGPDRYFRA